MINTLTKYITTTDQKEKAWIIQELKVIGEITLNTLITQTLEAQKKAYIPYSHYPVGAALLCESGNIYQGCNAETVNYSLTVHAEGSAITNAIAHGETVKQRQFIKAIIFVSNDNDIGPCGQCRQHIAEHCDNCLIISINKTREVGLVSSLQELFPYPFTPSKLGIK